MDPNFVPPLEGAAGDSSFMTTDAETPNTKHVTIPGGGQRWQGLKDPDLEEDAYFNTTSDEEDDEDELSKDVPTETGMYGRVTKKRTHVSLVPYADDDDDNDDVEDMVRREIENEGKDVVVTPKRSISSEIPESSPITADHESPSTSNLAAAPSTPATSNAPSSTPPRPLPSLAEKRRREEDDEDELGKLASAAKPSKRRNSSAGKLKDMLKQNTADDVDAADTEQPEKLTEKTSVKIVSRTPSLRRTPSLKRKKGIIFERSKRSVSGDSGSGSGTAAAAGASDAGENKKEKEKEKAGVDVDAEEGMNDE